MVNYYGGINLDLLARLPLAANSVLEIGCGEGNLGRAFKARNPAAFYMGVELFEGAANQARNHLDRVIVGDIEQDQVVAALDATLEGRRFDLLVFGNVLEHLRDPWAVLALLRERMAPGGVCVACIPNVAHWSLLVGQLKGQWDYADYGLLDRTHLRFFTAESAQAMFRQAGWSVADTAPRVIQAQETEVAIKAFAPMEAAFSIDHADLVRNLSAFQWVIRAVNGPVPEPLHLSAMTLSKQGGVTEVRIEEPLAALATQPAVTARWATQGMSLPPGKPGVAIFQRNFLDHPPLWEGANRITGRGWALVSEMDDDPNHWTQFAENDHRAFRGVHAVTVSTEPLAEVIRAWNPNVAVFPNAIASLTETSPTTPKSGDRLRIFFGAINRRNDWEPLKTALMPMLESLSERIEMVVVNDQAFFDALPPSVPRTFQELLPYGAYKTVLASCDIALLPLADTPFNRLKSDLKLIECCAAGVVPICSPIVYAEDPRNVEVAVIADGVQPFVEALADLCADIPRLIELRAKGLAYVSSQRMQAQQVVARSAFYRDLLDNHGALEAQRQTRIGISKT